MSPRAEALALARAALFAELNGVHLAEIAAAGVRRSVTAGYNVFAEGAPATTLYVVLAGRVRVTQAAPTGQRMVLHFGRPGDVLGCAVLGGARTYPGTAEVQDDAQLLAFDERVLRGLVARFPTLSHNALRVLAGRVDDLRERLRELTLDAVDRRLAHVLVRLARQAESDLLQPDFEFTRQDLAELVGATQFTVSRIVARWAKEGWIDASRGHVRVRNVEALRRI